MMTPPLLHTWPRRGEELPLLESSAAAADGDEQRTINHTTDEATAAKTLTRRVVLCGIAFVAVVFMMTSRPPPPPEEEEDNELLVEHADAAAAAAGAFDYNCVSSPADGPVLGGIDVVALLDAAEAGENTLPSEFLTAESAAAFFSDTSLGGYEFRFLSSANLDRFQEDPVKFLPRYGGFCAYGVSGLDAYSTDLAAICISDAELYELCGDELCFFRNTGARNLWNQAVGESDLNSVIEASDAIWQTMISDSSLGYCFNTDLVSFTTEECMINDPPPPSSARTTDSGAETAVAAGDGSFARFRSSPADGDVYVETTTTYKCTSSPDSGPVLGGIDMVALVNNGFLLDDEGGRVDPLSTLGVSAFSDTSLGGFEFWFANADNLRLFQDDPEAWVPAYGGFCSWSVSGLDERATGLAGICLAENDHSTFDYQSENCAGGHLCFFQDAGAQNLWNDAVDELGVDTIIGQADANFASVDNREYCFNTDEIFFTSDDC